MAKILQYTLFSAVSVECYKGESHILLVVSVFSEPLQEMEQNKDKSAPDKKYQCEDCEFKSNYKSNLLRHVNNIHGKRREKKSIFTCQATSTCKYKTTIRRNLRRHIAAVHEKIYSYSCQHCKFTTNSKLVLERHKRHRHKGKSFALHSCGVCRSAFPSSEDYQAHLDTVHPPDENFKLVNSAFKKSLRIYSKHLRLKAVDTSCLWDLLPSIKQLCERILSSEFTTFTLNLTFWGIFEKLSPIENEDEAETETFPMKTNRFLIRPNVRYRRIMRSMIRQLDDHVENILHRGSGFVLTEALKVHLEISRTTPIRFGCNDEEYDAESAVKDIR